MLRLQVSWPPSSKYIVRFLESRPCSPMRERMSVPSTIPAQPTKYSITLFIFSAWLTRNTIYLFQRGRFTSSRLFLTLSLSFLPLPSLWIYNVAKLLKPGSRKPWLNIKRSYISTSFPAFSFPFCVLLFRLGFLSDRISILIVSVAIIIVIFIIIDIFYGS